MPHPALLLLLHGAGPVETLMIVAPTVGVLALIGGVLVAPFFRGAAKLNFPSAYGIAVGGLIVAGLILAIAASVMDGGFLDDRWGEWRVLVAAAGTATTLISLGSVVPMAGRVLRVLAVLGGVASVAFVAFIFLMS